MDKRIVFTEIENQFMLSLIQKKEKEILNVRKQSFPT